METEYWAFRKLVEGCLKQTEGAGLTEREAINLFDKAVKYQIFLESREIQTRAFSGVEYSERGNARFLKILETVRGENAVETLLGSTDKVDKFQRYDSDRGRYVDHIEGLVAESRDLIPRAGQGVVTAQARSLAGMIDILRDMEIRFIQLYGDLRLMSGLNTFSISQRTKVNDDLLKEGFEAVVAYLDHAERNLRAEHPPHWKDALSNCRNALEETVHGLMRIERLTITKSWSNDLADLSKERPNLIDDATKKMLQGIYGYLSDLGSHAFTKIAEDNVEPVEFGFDQTYRVLAHVLLRVGKET
jgi:hypothetical protein